MALLQLLLAPDTFLVVSGERRIKPLGVLFIVMEILLVLISLTYDRIQVFPARER